MKNWETIQQHLKNYYQEDFTNFLKNKKYNFEKAINLFSRVCDIQEVEEVLNDLVEEQKQTLTRSTLALQLETYVKQIFLIVDEQSFSGTLAPCLKEIFSRFGIISEYDKQRFFAKDVNLNPTELPETFKHTIDNFGQDVKRSYDIRNAAAHGRELSKRTITDDIYGLINTYLYFTALHYTQLVAKLEEQKSNQLNFRPYLKKTIEQFKKKISRFVHLDTQEDLNISEAYVIEYDLEDYNENAEEEGLKQERRGTVDDLRKNKVHEKRMMLWGDAGMGKSTTMEYLVYQDAKKCLNDKQANIPIYIPLGILTERSQSIKEAIFNKLTVTEEVGENLLKKGRLNLFLDGINEIPKDYNSELRTYRNKEIQKLLTDYPNTFFILSNRPQDENIFTNVPVFQLQKMDDNQLLLFLEKNCSDKPTKKKIIDELKENNRLKRIVRTPLMLSRLIMVVIQKGEIPKSRGEIINEFIQGLYIREKIEKKDAAFDKRLIHRLLSRLGYYSLEEKGTNSGLTENEVINEFAKCKNEFGFSLDVFYVLRIANELNILEEQEGKYIFAHQEYQDYYHAVEERAILGL
ncbi:MAG: NACHT domain-containing NTPase [Saprospiraceae bacterium]